MLNEFNIKIFDFIFSTNIGLKGDYLDNSNDNYLCSQLSDLIKDVCEEYDFWDEYKIYFNDNCVIDASTLSGRNYIYNEFPKFRLNTKKMYLNYKLEQVKKLLKIMVIFRKKNLK